MSIVVLPWELMAIKFLPWRIMAIELLVAINSILAISNLMAIWCSVARAVVSSWMSRGLAPFLESCRGSRRGDGLKVVSFWACWEVSLYSFK